MASRRKSRLPLMLSRNDSRPLLLRLRSEDRRLTNNDGYTSRFSAPHPLGEEHPADYPRDEVRRRGSAAPPAGTGHRGPSVPQGTSAHAAFHHLPYFITQASAPG